MARGGVPHNLSRPRREWLPEMSLRLHLILLVLVCMLPAVALLAIDQVQLRRARETEVPA